jgi:hypothetical protein
MLNVLGLINSQYTIQRMKHVEGQIYSSGKIKQNTIRQKMTQKRERKKEFRKKYKRKTIIE